MIQKIVEYRGHFHRLDQICLYHLVMFRGLGTVSSRDEALLSPYTPSHARCEAVQRISPFVRRRSKKPAMSGLADTNTRTGRDGIACSSGAVFLFGDLDPDLLSWAFPFWLCESVSVKMLAFGSTWILLRKL